MGAGLESLLDALPVSVFEVACDGRVTLARGADREAVTLRQADIQRAIGGERFAIRVEEGGRWFELRYVPHVDAAGLVTGVGVVAFDVTERRIADERAQHASWFLDSIIEHIPDMVFVKDAKELRFVRFNQAGEHLLGVGEDQLLGKNDYDFFPKEQADFFVAKDREVLARGTVLDIPEEPIHTHSVGDRFLHTKKIPIKDEHGTPVYLLGISRDVTDRKRAAEEREGLFLRLQELDRLKSQFFANISHELRTPLTLILALSARLLAAAGANSKEGRDLSSILNNAKVVLHHVSDLLDLAKVDALMLEPRYTPIDLSELTRLTASSFEVLATARGVRYQLDAPATLPVEVDGSMVQRVLTNLLSNAFKFVPARGRVRCSLRASNGSVVLEVADSGPGVPSDARARTFERFTQLESGLRRNSSGTGLGLAIARELTSLHRGTIEIGDAPEGGALLSVTLPRKAPKGVLVGLREEASLPSVDVVGSSFTPGPSATSNPLGAERVATDPLRLRLRPVVLVVEDHPELRRYLSELLAADYEVLTAADGLEALALAEARPPDLVVTDLMMPRMSGEELVDALRGHTDLARVPILVLTAAADDAVRVRLLRRGVEDYILKPFQADELCARVGNLVAAKRARDVLQEALASRDVNIESLAVELAARERTIQLALQVAVEARAASERAGQVKFEFLGLVSHELRSPLALLQLQLQLLERKSAEPDGTTQVPMMLTAVRRLEELVASLIDEASIEDGSPSFASEPIDLGLLAADVLAERRARLGGKPLELVLSTPPDLPALRSERRGLRLILENLVDNGIEYTPRGSVTLTISGNLDGHRLVVTDTGNGMPSDTLGAIFEPFAQGLPLAYQKLPGVGLGLARIHRLVRALGGTLLVTSQDGQGTEVTVTLPGVAESAHETESEWASSAAAV